MRVEFFFISTFLILSRVFASPITSTLDNVDMEEIKSLALGSKVDFEEQNFKEYSLYSSSPDHACLRKTKIKKTRTLLDRYLAHLKEFLSEKYFNFIRFDTQLSKITEELFQIDKLMDSVDPPSEELVNQYNFMKEMYRTMLVFNEFRQNFKKGSGIQDHLFTEINKLGILRFGLYDTHGMPDHEIEGYDDYLLELISRWNSLNEEKNGLEKSASIMQLILDIDFKKVKKSLMELAGHTENTEMDGFDWIPF